MAKDDMDPASQWQWEVTLVPVSDYILRMGHQYSRPNNSIEVCEQSRDILFDNHMLLDKDLDILFVRKLDRKDSLDQSDIQVDSLAVFLHNLVSNCMQVVHWWPCIVHCLHMVKECMD